MSRNFRLAIVMLAIGIGTYALAEVDANASSASSDITAQAPDR